MKKYVKSNYLDFINENKKEHLSKGDVIEVMTIFGQGIDELKDVDKKYIGRLYIVDEIEDDESVKILGGGTWMLDDVRKLSKDEIKNRKDEIDKIYSDIENDKVYRRKQNSVFVLNHINNIKNYFKTNIFDIEEKSFDLSNDQYEITLTFKKK